MYFCTMYICLYVFVDIYDEAQNVNKAFNLSCLLSPFTVFTMRLLLTFSPQHQRPLTTTILQFPLSTSNLHRT